MNSEKVNNWLQVVGMFGIIASLVFVGFQARQTQAIGEGEAKFAHLFRAYSQGSFFAWLGAQNNILELNPQDVVYSFAANIHRYPGLAQTNLSFRRGWAVEGLECNRDV
jgi:hypothetical protein